VLASGSAGNATLVSDGTSRVLIDAGLSYRELTRRLLRLDIDPAAVDAVFITHAHGDHTRGAGLLSRRHGVPVHATPAIRSEWGAADVAVWRTLRPGRARTVGGLRFVPFEIPHDTAAVGFRVETAEGAIGYATDVGALTPPIVARLRDCRVLVIESNHAAELLRVSPYARATRERIAGAEGHLSNEALATFVREELADTVRCIVLAHVSRVNNLPELAAMTCREALDVAGRSDVRVVVSHQERVTETVRLDVRPARSGPDLSPGRQIALPFQVSATS
jgi:phosphoribosyl 1,2-cyclic phosphodiesterase